jgi:hypothetical protein
MDLTAPPPERELTAMQLAPTRTRRTRVAARRRAARIDGAIGVSLALLALALAPGLALVGIIASALLVLCGLSVLLARRRAHRTTGVRGTAA